jgi:hypothetical protein
MFITSRSQRSEEDFAIESYKHVVPPGRSIFVSNLFVP